jgi:hypothetical protein
MRKMILYFVHFYGYCTVSGFLLVVTGNLAIIRKRHQCCIYLRVLNLQQRRMVVHSTNNRKVPYSLPLYLLSVLQTTLFLLEVLNMNHLFIKASIH